MSARPAIVALLLFGSGFSALVYQIAWLREFRLVFGASTAASAAVLAIFMGGLGVGGLLIGRRADRHPRPLALYAKLELFIALYAALTPLLIMGVRALYLALGGQASLGGFGATVVRLLLSLLVLSVPTILMGGTLPAAAKAALLPEDANRRGLALLYGANTLGAVAGCVLATFFLLEHFGARQTLWLACALNLVVALAAQVVSAQSADGASTEEAPAADSARPSSSTRYVLIAAFGVGFAFMLMELVWYRMLNPLLGGSTFTFGLILAVALSGIGLGGAAYSWVDPGRRVTLRAFALTCLLEALCIGVPYALGDGLAVFNILLRSLAGAGFLTQVLGWTLICAIMVFPAAFVAGFQFPLLIALLGSGREGVARETGLAIAWNTAGAIAGSLAGGFGVLPLLSAVGAWFGVVVLLLALGLGAALLAFLADRSIARLLAPGAVALLAAACLTATGPTAAWRNSHGGDVHLSAEQQTRNGLKDWVLDRRRHILWEKDGVESSVALAGGNGYAFVINGRTDGNARSDAPTQVMVGMLGAILHPEPKAAMVVGLGTGSTGGWLGSVESIQRVDVVELEPAILDIARACAPVNMNVLDNPKVKIFAGDAREFLLATRERYDLIVSEPSNPYRAGIASLFTQEFYESLRPRLAEGGMFLQWLQAYQVSAQTIRTVLATLAAVFPTVEVWQTSQGDLLLLCANGPVEYDLAAIAARLGREPMKKAAAAAWRADSIEAIFSHYVASSALPKAILELERHAINTDDRTLIEFAFARSVGRGELFNIAQLRQLARQRGEDRPAALKGKLDWNEVDYERLCGSTAAGQKFPAVDLSAPATIYHRAMAQYFWQNGDLRGAAAEWRSHGLPPRGQVEVPLAADILANAGDDQALKLAEELRIVNAADAEAVLARFHFSKRNLPAASAALIRCFESMRADPWHWPALTQKAVDLAGEVASQDRALAPALFDALRQPFSVRVHDDLRENLRLELSGYIDLKATIAVLEAFEPNVPWKEKVLVRRYRCYEAARHPLLSRAEADLSEFLENEPAPLNAGLLNKPGEKK